MQYSVKILYTYSIGKTNKKIYEETILLVDAYSFDEAMLKAEEYAESCTFDYINTDNEGVKTEKIEVIDCFLAFDQENNVREVYSAFFSNHTSLSEDGFYDAVTSRCDDSEMLSLQNKDYN